MGTGAGRAVIAAAALGSGIAFLDGTVVNVALRSIGEDLDASLSQLQWITNGYLLSLASLILLGGSLGDRFGRRRVFVIGTIWFAAASLLCGLAPNAEVLIAARVLQGVGGALLTPGSLAMIEGAFVQEDRAPAIGAWSGLTGISGAIGPFLGGALVQYADWRWIFLINLPIAALTVFIAVRAVPESRDPNASVHFDIPGAVLGTAALAGATYALIEWGGTTAWVAVVVSVARRGRVPGGRREDAGADAGARDLPQPDLQRLQHHDPAGVRRARRAELLRDHPAPDGERVRRARGRRGVRADDPGDAGARLAAAVGWASGSVLGSR